MPELNEVPEKEFKDERDSMAEELTDAEFEIVLLAWARRGINYKTKLANSPKTLVRAFRIRSTESYRSKWNELLQDILLDVEEEVVNGSDFNELRTITTINGDVDLAPNDLKRAISHANQKRWILERRNEAYRTKESKKLEIEEGVKVELVMPPRELGVDKE